MPLISREITTVPPGLPEDVKVWLEKILKDHYADIRELREQLDIQNWQLKEARAEDVTATDAHVEGNLLIKHKTGGTKDEIPVA